MNEVLLQLKGVSVHYGGVKALDDVSIDVDEGEVVALLGPNGAGKSTVLKAFFGLAAIAAGKVLWHGQAIEPVPYEMVGRGTSFVPQGRRVFAHLTVLENLEIGGYVVKNKKAVTERIQEVLTLFPDLKHKLRLKAGSLSGGQQQMLAIARGLIPDPKVLFLDEPSLGLAPKLVKLVFEKIKEINEWHKTALVVVEHNIKSLLNIAQRLYVLDKGRVTIFGPVAEVWSSDLLARVFLGERV